MKIVSGFSMARVIPSMMLSAAQGLPGGIVVLRLEIIKLIKLSDLFSAPLTRDTPNLNSDLVKKLHIRSNIYCGDALQEARPTKSTGDILRRWRKIKV